MFHAKDNKQGYIFDPFEYLGPKRLSELKNSWAEIFRSEILPELPVESLRKYYHEKNGRPSKEMYSMLGLMILQQMHDLTDEKAVGDFIFDIMPNIDRVYEPATRLNPPLVPLGTEPEEPRVVSIVMGCCT